MQLGIGLHLFLLQFYAIARFIVGAANKTDNSTNSNAFAMYGMVVFTSRDEETPRIELNKKTNDYEIKAYGQDVNKVTEVYVDRSPSCNDRFMHVKIIDRKDYSITGRILPGNKVTTGLLYLCFTPAANIMFDYFTLEKKDSYVLPLYIVACIFAYLMSAIFSGLNIALMSMDIDNLRLIKEHDVNPRKREYAENILPLRKNGNLLLCTIIFAVPNVYRSEIIFNLGNVLFNIVEFVSLSETLQLLFVEVLGSALQTIFTEILPSIFISKHSLLIGSYSRPVVIVFMVVLSPVAWPMSKMLDLIVGKHKSRHLAYAEMLVNATQQMSTSQLQQVVRNTMALEEKCAMDVMTSIANVTMIEDVQVLNRGLIAELAAKKHTRIPVCSHTNKDMVIGVLNVKDLLLLGVISQRNMQAKTLCELSSRSSQFRYVLQNTPVPQLIQEMKSGFSMAIVVEFSHEKHGYKIIGIVTLEDNLEEVIGEILDEKDAQKQERARLDRGRRADIYGTGTNAMHHKGAAKIGAQMSAREIRRAEKHAKRHQPHEKKLYAQESTRLLKNGNNNNNDSNGAIDSDGGGETVLHNSRPTTITTSLEPPKS